MPTATDTEPDPALAGTRTTRVAAVALRTVACKPLILTVSEKAVVEKPVPVMVSVSPPCACKGVKEVMTTLACGGGFTAPAPVLLAQDTKSIDTKAMVTRNLKEKFINSKVLNV